MSDPNSFVDENSPLAPVSLYAELKIKVEKYILRKLKETVILPNDIEIFNSVWPIK